MLGLTGSKEFNKFRGKPTTLLPNDRIRTSQNSMHVKTNNMAKTVFFIYEP